MPCSDGLTRGGPSYEEIRDHREVSAALCAVLTGLENIGRYEDCIGAIDWKKAGVTPAWLGSWWGIHKAQDARRLAQEAALQSALAKLTPEERDAMKKLG